MIRVVAQEISYIIAHSVYASIMRRFIPYALGLLLSLWVGGLVSLLVLVLHLFSYNKGLAVQVAPEMFSIFEKYELIVLTFALILGIVWKVINPSKLKNLIIYSIVLGAMLVGVEAGIITPKVNALRTLSATPSKAFWKYHAISQIINLGVLSTALYAGGAFIASRKREMM